MKRKISCLYSRTDSKKENRAAIIVLVIIMTISLVIGGIAGYMLWQKNQVYVEGNRSYKELYEMVRRSEVIVKDEVIVENEAEAKEDEGKDELDVDNFETEPIIYIPEVDIDFEALENINRDSIAWLYCPETVINYPVMKADDYSYYNYRLPDGTRNANGSLFMDYHCAPDFSDRLSVIYGHKMKSGRMFGSLTEYKKTEYYNKHPYMYLYTKQGNYRINLLYGFVIGKKEWANNAYMHPKNVDKLLEYAKENTTFHGETNYNDDSKFFAMSTCSYEFKGARYVVIGVLEPEHQG